jgi:hypothetical protein
MAFSSPYSQKYPITLAGCSKRTFDSIGYGLLSLHATSLSHVWFYGLTGARNFLPWEPDVAPYPPPR